MSLPKPLDITKPKLLLRSLESLIFGGTFDFLHFGHKFLLTAAVVLTKKQLRIGLSSEPLLEKKRNRFTMQHYPTRFKQLESFLHKLDPAKELDIFPLYNPYGPTINPEVTCPVIVSEETIKGGDAINKVRTEKGLTPLEVIVVGILGGDIVNRLSSTSIRTNISEKIIGGEETLIYLYDCWVELMKKIGVVQKDTCDLWFDKIKMKYCEPWRFYHTLNHVQSLLKLYRGSGIIGCDDLVIELTIWFHDVIYIPQHADNEKQSVKFFKEFIEDIKKNCKDINLSSDAIVEVENITIFTENHCQINPKIDESRTAQVFLDLDMSILGSPSDVYQVYSENIRKEYIHVPEELFREKRAKVLEHFLKSCTHIYRTIEFRELYEQKARENIKQEIESLIKGLSV